MKIEWTMDGDCRRDGIPNANSYQIVAVTIKKHCEKHGISVAVDWACRYTHIAEIPSKIFSDIRDDVRAYMANEPARLAQAQSSHEKLLAAELRQDRIDNDQLA